MNCREWEEAIALLVDGEPAVTGLAEHLEDCDACSQLYQDLRADQVALRAIPAVDGLLRVERRSRTASRWYAAAAAVAIAAGLTIVSLLVRMPGRRVEPIAEKPQPTMETHVPKRTASPPTRGAMATRKSPKERLRSVTAVELAIDSEWGRILSASPQIDMRPAQRGSTSEIAMRIQTGDPDVVILWLKEEVKGGSNE